MKKSVRSYMVLMICTLLLYTATAHRMEDNSPANEMKRRYRWPPCRSKIVHDHCKRECKCRNGRLYDCHRVRREFTTMTIAERKSYTRAVTLVSTHPSLKNDYENLLTSHRTLFNQRIHNFEYFLPWHRWFILQYENLLRRVDCRITVPYWDYTLTAGAPFAGPLWNETDAGLGGNGEGSPPCVKTGPFREGQWSLIASAGGGCLTRSFIGGPLPDAVALAQLLSMFSSAEKDLRDFELMLRSEFHDFIHFAIGGFSGTMSSINAAAAPEFFLLHAMVDKIWADWQEKSPRHAYPPEFLYQTAKMPGTEYQSRDFLNLSEQPRCTAVRYGQPGAKWVAILSKIRKVAAQGISTIRLIPRPKFGRVPDKMLDLFKVSKAERKRLKELYNLFNPTTSQNGTPLRGTDKKLGFKMDAINKILAG